MTLKSQHAATLQLPEDDPYYSWELKFLDRPDTMARYMRAAKWYVFFLSLAQRSTEGPVFILSKETRRRQEAHREDHGVETRL